MPVKRLTLIMLLTYLNRSVSTKLSIWKFCFHSLWLSFITKQDHDLLWNSQWSPNVISCKCIFEFLLSLMNKSPRPWVLQLLPLLKLKVVVACNRFGDWRSNVCLSSFVPNLLFSVLSDSFISPAACCKHSQPDPSLLLLAGTVAPPEMILLGGCLPRHKNQTSWSWHLQLQLAVLRKYTDNTNHVLIKAGNSLTGYRHVLLLENIGKDDMGPLKDYISWVTCAGFEFKTDLKIDLFVLKPQCNQAPGCLSLGLPSSLRSPDSLLESNNDQVFPFWLA